MMIWKISQNVNSDYDTYSDAVVIAADAESARRMHPSGDVCDGSDLFSWVDPKDVIVELIGVAFAEASSGVITASFHAG